MTHPTNPHSAFLSDTLSLVPTSKAAALQPHLPANTYYFLGFFFFIFFFIVTMWAGISWWFWFARPWWLVTLSIFSRASHLMHLLSEKCVQILCPFLNSGFLLLLLSTSFPLLPSRTAHLVTTEGSFRKVTAGEHALLGPVCPAIATTTVTPVTRKPGSVCTLVCVGACLTLKITAGTGCLLFWLSIYTSSLI